MAEEATFGADPVLERRLAELGPYLDYPPTPRIAHAVRLRLTTPALRRRWWSPGLPLPRALAFAVLAIVLGLVSLLVAWPQARTAVSDRLGIRGVTVEQPPRGVRPPAVGAPLDLGERVTLESARDRAAFPLVVPTLPELGEPDDVYFSAAVPGGQVALAYRAGPGVAPAPDTGIGLLLLQFRGLRSPDDLAVLQKQLSANTQIEAVVIDGERGVWIEGDSHMLSIPDRSGQRGPDRVRLAGNVLLWERGQVSLRLEGAIAKELALRIASSVG